MKAKKNMGSNLEYLPLILVGYAAAYAVYSVATIKAYRKVTGR